MNKICFLAAIVFVFFVYSAAGAQDPPKFEIAGDTIIHVKRQTVDGQALNPVTRQFDPFLFVIPGRTSHNFQFVASVGFRF